MFYEEEYIQRVLGENPPILNSFSEEDISQILSNWQKILTLDFHWERKAENG